MKAGFFILGDYNWAGGIYYILNILRTLKFSKDLSKFEFTFFYNDKTPTDILEEVKQFDGEMCNLDNINLLTKTGSRIQRTLTGKGYRIATRIQTQNPEFLFPLIEYNEEIHSAGPVPIYWIYDFQHKFYPELFSEEEIKRRDKNFDRIALNAKHIVVSSNNSADHFRKYYPNSKASLHVFHFSSIISDYSFITEEQIRTKFELKRPFFIVCNQFWKHKNHSTVIKAYSKLTETKNVDLVFTGKYNENDEYFNSLKKEIQLLQNSKNIHFTGFINREEQLALMRNSIAVIQPSLFEGWSTVVEDAKALEKPLLLSDLEVHREQVKKNALFFSPLNSDLLNDKMIEILENNFKFEPENYVNNVLNSAQEFMDISHQIQKTVK